MQARPRQGYVMKSNYHNGVTLIELIVTLSISTTLLTIGAPSFIDLSDQIRADSNIRKIQQTLQLARNAAISYGYRVTACPLVDNRCTENWQKGITVFIDTGTVNILDANDRIINMTGEFDERDFLDYNRSSVKFQPDGLASGSNGTFKYCPRTYNSQYSRAVIINQAGRVRFSTAKNIDCG